MAWSRRPHWPSGSSSPTNPKVWTRFPLALQARPPSTLVHLEGKFSKMRKILFAILVCRRPGSSEDEDFYHSDFGAVVLPGGGKPQAPPSILDRATCGTVVVSSEFSRYYVDALSESGHLNRSNVDVFRNLQDLL